jgi:hypothetical protein
MLAAAAGFVEAYTEARDTSIRAQTEIAAMLALASEDAAAEIVSSCTSTPLKRSATRWSPVQH